MIYHNAVIQAAFVLRWIWILRLADALPLRLHTCEPLLLLGVYAIGWPSAVFRWKKLELMMGLAWSWTATAVAWAEWAKTKSFSKSNRSHHSNESNFDNFHRSANFGGAEQQKRVKTPSKAEESEKPFHFTNRPSPTPIPFGVWIISILPWHSDRLVLTECVLYRKKSN